MENEGYSTNMLDPRRNQREKRIKPFEEMLLKEIKGSRRTNEPMHAVLEGELSEMKQLEAEEFQNVRNRALIQYLSTLANSNSTKDKFDFDFVESLLKNGADINSADKTGQCVFHEVARSWNIDVAKFLIEHGANVNQQDQYGRSPLHVAAAVDYAEMVEFLLENGADIDIKTSGEGQTPIHFAAKNDAINSLQMLLGYGADIDGRDSKNRTPLQVSAEMNRSKAAKLLVAEGAPAGVYDNLGNSALSLLIEKIPEVALDAMDQFHSVDTINRKEFYFLNYLESTKLKEEKTPARTPLEIAVQNERFDIIMHPVMQRLIGLKWQMYGKWGAILDLVINLVYAILWTVLAVTLPRIGQDLYWPLAEHSWRLVIGILLILFTIMEIRKQILNTIKTRNELKKWREWRAAELERDLAYCHPRWPQEDQYLRAEIKAVRNLSLISGSDWWIYFDWAALVLILATIASHVTFFHFSNDISKEIHHYILIPLLLILWLRIFKYARPFEGAGPFVVIFGHVLGDIVKWAFLNSIIIIPFACAFWITFGAISLTPVQGYDNVGPLLYNIFSMMVVNDHNYEKLEEANPVMARLLCGAFIGIAAIVTLNLLIALLTNTFERLYENAVANAVMQRARTILLLQKSLRKKQKKKYYDFIKTNGSPEVIVKTLGRLSMMDGDDHATIERVRDDVKVIVNLLSEKFGRKFGKGKKSDLDFVKMDVSKVRRFQEELIVDVKNMKQTLKEITEKVREMDNTDAKDMKQTLQIIAKKLEDIKRENDKGISNNITTPTGTQQRLRDRSRKCRDDSETGTSEDDSNDGNSTTKKQHAKLFGNEKMEKRNRATVVTSQTDDSRRPTHQPYPRQSISTNPETWRQNSGDPFSNSQYSYNTNHAGIQAHSPYDQWSTVTPDQNAHPHMQHSVENPLLHQGYDFNKRLSQDFSSPNVNQQLYPYNMGHSRDKNHRNSYPPPIEKSQSSQSSPVAREIFVNQDFYQPRSNESNGYRQMVRNMSVSTDGETINPVLSVSDQQPASYTHMPPQPTTCSVTKKQFETLEMQYSENDLNHDDAKQYTTTCIEQPSHLNEVLQDEILRSETKTPDNLDDHTTLGPNLIAKHQTTDVQSASEKSVISDDNKAIKADTSQNIRRIQNETSETSIANNEANLYREYGYPSTKIAPRIQRRVSYFEEKLDEIYSSTSTSYGKEIQPIHLSTSKVSDAAALPTSNDASRAVSNDLAKNMTQVPTVESLSVTDQQQNEGYQADDISQDENTENVHADDDQPSSPATVDI
ncbi:uncharacterized protein LOC114531074 [Dendronephthya gigantea]|uniref:uncharacterized protein LOC114531074 n=1 Tax=Dendronephthya gigantea TaxID=151771 RepID=UPI00106BDFF4|nr:uncharacterized protein LOC114531074 [Dendronephthya gigantea]